MNDRIKGIIVSYMQVAVSLVVSFLYVPLLITAIGDSEYGLYQMVGSFFSFINIFETSLSQGVMKFYCDAKAKNDVKQMKHVLATAKNIYYLLSVISSIGSIFIVIIYNIFYQSSLTRYELYESTLMLIILLVNFIVSIINAPYLAVIYANEKFAFARMLTMLTQIAQFVLCIVFIKIYPYSITIVIIQFILNVVMTVIRCLYSKNTLNVFIGKKEHNNVLSRMMILFAGSILLSTVADQIFWKTDQLILGKFYNTKYVAVYSVGMQLTMCYMNIGLVVSSVFFPKVSVLNSEDNADDNISKLFVRTGTICFILLLLILSGFVLFGKEFIILWAGRTYIEAYYIAIIVMLPFTIDIIQNIGLTILQVKGLYTFRSKMYLVSASINVIGTAIFAYYFGGYGAAASTGISLLIVSGGIMNWYYIRYAKLNVKLFWKKIFIIIVRFIPIFISGFLIESIVETKSLYVSLIVKCILYSILYVIWGYYFVINNEEKNLLKTIVNNFIKK